MTWTSALARNRAALHLVRALIVILTVLGSRTVSFASPAPAYDGKRPRPSKQSLPTHPVRPAVDSDSDAGRKLAPPWTAFEVPPPQGTAPVLSSAGQLHLRTESTKPEYLQFFRATGVPPPLAPPA